MSRRLSILLCLLMIVSILPTGYYSFEAGQRSAQLQANVCKVVAESSRGNAAQHAFWVAAQHRAMQRSHDERGDLRASDLDAAKNDARIAAVYAANGFHFPGC